MSPIQAVSSSPKSYDINTSVNIRKNWVNKLLPWLKTEVVVCMMLLVIAAAPLVTARIAPLQDWPSHLSRVRVLAAVLAGDPFWSQYYEFSTFLLPNIALDAGVLMLMKLGFSVEAAGTLFLLSTYALFVSGFYMLARACSAASAEKLPLGIVLFYSMAVFWGLVNYVVGVGVILWALALYVAAPARVGLKLGLAIAATLVIFECHVIAAVLFVLVLACHDTSRVYHAGRFRLRYAMSFAGSAGAGLVFILLYALSPTGADNQSDIAYSDLSSLFGFLKQKLGVFAKAFLGGSVSSDIVFMTCVVIALGLSLFLRRVRLPLWAVMSVVVLAVVTLVAPQRVGAGSMLDSRIPVVPLLIAAATVRFEWRKAWARHTAFALLAVGVAARSTALVVDWSRAGTVLDGLDAHFSSLPAHSTLLVAMGRPDVNWIDLWSPPIGNSATLAVGHGVFVPRMFALASQQPLVLRRPFRQWSLPPVVANQAALDQEVARARVLCETGLAGTTPSKVQMLIMYPSAFLRGGTTMPPMRPLLGQFGILDLCTPSDPGPSPWMAAEQNTHLGPDSSTP